MYIADHTVCTENPLNTNRTTRFSQLEREEKKTWFWKSEVQKMRVWAGKKQRAVSTGTCKYRVTKLTEKLSLGARKFHCYSEWVHKIWLSSYGSHELHVVKYREGADCSFARGFVWTERNIRILFAMISQRYWNFLITPWCMNFMYRHCPTYAVASYVI